jgi:hypothetical protein
LPRCVTLLTLLSNHAATGTANLFSSAAASFLTLSKAGVSASKNAIKGGDDENSL